MCVGVCVCASVCVRVCACVCIRFCVFVFVCIDSASNFKSIYMRKWI